MKELNYDYIKGYLNILILEFIALSVVIISITAIRFASPDFFNQLKEIYEDYALADTDVSLVLGGEKD